MNENMDHIFLIWVKFLKVFSKVHSKGLFKMGIRLALFLSFIYSFLLCLFFDKKLQCV